MVGRLRLWSGYVLLFYVTTHLLNHALGLISLRVVEAGRVWFVFIWQGFAGQTVLYGALLVLYGVALLVPAAGLGGAAIALRDFAELAREPGFLREVFERAHAGNAEDAATLYMIADSLAVGAVVVLLAGFAARPVRDWWERRAGVVHLSYGEGKTVAAPAGLSLLEMSRMGGIPPASVCGGPC